MCHRQIALILASRRCVPASSAPMLNYIWLALVLLAVLLGGATGNMEKVTSAIFDSAKTAVTLSISLIGVMALWLGVMRLAERSGLVQVIARALRPLMRWLFPDVPPEHPAMGSIVMNMAANMLGLGNAATPLGLRAMAQLERLNPHPGTATNAMCTFLAINTSSIQLIPATTVALLSAAGSVRPSAIIGTSLIATTCSTIVGIASVKLLERFSPKPTGDGVASRGTDGTDTPVSEDELPEPPRLLAWWGKAALAVLAAFFAWLFITMAFDKQAPAPGEVRLSLKNGETVAGQIASESTSEITARYPDGSTRSIPKSEITKIGRHEHPALRAVDTISVLAVPLLLAFFPLYAAMRGLKVYEEFVEGAKEGFNVAVRVIPYLVTMLVAVGMFRESGGIDLITRALRPALALLSFPPELLPLALMRPLSGSGSNAIFADLISTFGPDHLLTRMAGTIIGSTETTFYVLAVYFGAVAVRRTRHALPAGLLADAAGVVAAIFICRLVFQ
jgi:spore maturation protein SpmA